MVLYPMNELLEHIESRYLLVNMVAHRARQISEEAEETEIPLEEKPVTIALEEVRSGQLRQEREITF
ncbi:MAG: DNA-directed RNA polymerase subunit omega [Oscillospiraceae bacterium]|nr:DNA-directed RNA polymerase subunit omega [Oscillospiraceae bacterium]